MRKERVRGEKYDEFVDRFVTACRKRYPKAYIHFEDFGLNNARRILEKYTPKMACFNDDVQGTGAVTLAAIMAAFKEAKVDWADARFIMFGSGKPQHRHMHDTYSAIFRHRRDGYRRSNH